MGMFDLLQLPFFEPLLISVLAAWAHLVLAVRQFPKTPKVRWWILAGLLAVTASFLLLAVYRAATTPVNELRERRITGIADVPYSTCLVFGFPDAEALGTGKAATDPSTATELARLQQDPPGCVDKLKHWLTSEPPSQINVYGRADRRRLSDAARAKVISNDRLAQLRAESVARWLAANDQTDTGATGNQRRIDSALIGARTHTGVSGVRYITREAQFLEIDRSVEIEAFWPRQEAPAVLPSPTPKPGIDSVGRRLNDGAMDPSVALAVLSLFVALSAYLATVGFFMRQRASELQKQIDELAIEITHRVSAETPMKKDIMDRLSGKKVETELHLALLPIADLPMIFAALFLSLHLFFFLPVATVRISIVLATFAAMMLIMQHAGVWYDTVKRHFT